MIQPRRQILALVLLLGIFPLMARAETSLEPKEQETEYVYAFQPREHTFSDRLRDGAIVFGAATILYPITQPEILDGHTGSWTKYKRNFGKVVFDQDEPVWNFLVHPLSGSQMFLYYRARGYSNMDAASMTAISSALFEFTIEIFSEPASAQDLFNTPVLGSILGYGIERVSFSLLNSGSPFGEVIGHVINPCTLFTERTRVVPQISSRVKALYFAVDF